ncbi:hypothetical protein BH10PSE12_BH10PSE12_01590 [soil metagenome]
MTGLEQIRALMASGRRPAMMDLLDLNLVEIEAGRAVFSAQPSAAVYNPMGAVHGGYAATVLDSACGLAVHSRLDASQGYTTLELKIAYHRPMTKDTGPLQAIGTVLSVGRRVAFAEAKLIGPDDRLYASATSTLLVFAQEQA